jgi:hypothetical protein
MPIEALARDIVKGTYDEDATLRDHDILSNTHLAQLTGEIEDMTGVFINIREISPDLSLSEMHGIVTDRQRGLLYKKERTGCSRLHTVQSVIAPYVGLAAIV